MKTISGANTREFIVFYKILNFVYPFIFVFGHFKVITVSRSINSSFKVVKSFFAKDFEIPKRLFTTGNKYQCAKR